MGMSIPPRAVAVVAEDEPILRLAAIEFLEENGFSVLEAATAARALRYLEEHDDVRLLFTDVRMPGQMDGLALARIVAERWPGIAIVICSGVNRPPAHEIPSGATFIEKPFEDGPTRSLIQGLVGMHVGTGSTGQPSSG